MCEECHSLTIVVIFQILQICECMWGVINSVRFDDAEIL